MLLKGRQQEKEESINSHWMTLRKPEDSGT
jgi:hypothetical protein